MVSLKTKKINGGSYLYAEHSFRLPDGSIKKISKRTEKTDKSTNDYFFQEEIKAYQAFALDHYTTDAVFSKEQLLKLEQFRVEYKHIKKKLSKKQVQDVIDRFTVNFTYESNALEGNSLTLKDVTLLFTENRLPRNKDLREVYETRNMRRATELLFTKKNKTHKRLYT